MHYEGLRVRGVGTVGAQIPILLAFAMFGIQSQRLLIDLFLYGKLCCTCLGPRSSEFPRRSAAGEANDFPRSIHALKVCNNPFEKYPHCGHHNLIALYEFREVLGGF